MAVFCWVIAEPFRPSITFAYVPVPDGVNKNGSPPMVVHVVNSGIWPVWYSCHDGHVVGLNYYLHPQDPNDEFRFDTTDKWGMLSAGEHAIIWLDSQSLYDNPSFEVDFQDWRGREEKCSSQVFYLQKLNNYGSHRNVEVE